MADENGSKPENGKSSETKISPTIEEISETGVIASTKVAEIDQKTDVIEPKKLSDASGPKQLSDAIETRKLSGAFEPRRLSDVIEPRKISNAVEPNNVSEAEGQVKKLPYPKSIFFIISNEFCERYSHTGMRTILALYLSRQLGYSDNSATVIFHIFTMLVYFLCIFGAIISDSWLGKFKTILYLSLVNVCGSIMVTLGAMPPLNLPATTFTMIGLALVALGSGGIKPCVFAFGGDQFKLPEQVIQMASYFSLFYFSLNAGSLISSTVTPILRQDVHCFGEKECYSLAFGVPAVLMTVSTIIFILGRPLYKSKPPAGNMIVLVSKTIGNALSTKHKEKKTNPHEHWLDYANKKYDRQLIEDVKILMRVLVLFIPLPIFWALFEQQFSRWTFQATRMDGDMGSWDIKPDQLQMLNPLLVLVFIPLYDVAFYPLLSLIGIRRPLQKLIIGGILAGIAFIISGVVELELEKTYPTLPSPYLAQLRIFNGESCNYVFDHNIPNMASINLGPYDYYENKGIPIPYTGKFQLEYSLSTTEPGCYNFAANSYDITDREAFTLFMSSKNTTNPTSWYKDYVNKPSRGSPMGRTLSNVQPGRTISWKLTKKGSLEHEEPAYTHNLTEFSAATYTILVDNVKVDDFTLKNGGVYTVLINENNDGTYASSIFEITPPNSVSILWLIPQYVVMALAEVMFSVTGLEFSYSQAPVSMKSVLSACWLLTVAFGSVIVVVIAELSLFESQAYEFFLFAGLMFADMVLFMFMAYRYIPNNPMAVSETTPLTGDNSDADPKYEIKV